MLFDKLEIGQNIRVGDIKLNGLELNGAFKDLASTKPVATEGVLKATLDALSNKLENKAISPFELKYKAPAVRASPSLSTDGSEDLTPK